MPPKPEEKSRIEELKKSLYSRNAPDVRTRRKLRFSAPSESTVQEKWVEPDDTEPVEMNDHYEDHSMSFLKKILIGSLVFCLLAVGIGAYLFLNGANLISADNINITINGPVSIPGGTPVAFTVNVTNNNNVELQGVDMTVAFPAGATDPTDSTKVLTSVTQYLGNMSPLYATSSDVSAIIFGEENTQKQIVATLTYKIKGSSALFTKQQTYAVLINSSPISVTIDSVSSITSGQPFDMTIHLKSNSTDTLKNVLLKAQYPFGYTFISANLPPLSDHATWKIGDIPSGAERTIVISGKLEGQDTDIRAFHFSVGAKSNTNSAVIGTQYTSLEQDLTIEKSFISLTMGIDNDQGNGDFVGNFNKSEHITISWFNNLSVAVSNAVITVQLSGLAYDRNNVQPDSGYYNSVNNTITWNQQTNSDLASVDAGGSGKVSFSIIPIDHGTDSNPTLNPTILMSASVSGNRTQESGVTGNLSSIINRTIKVASNVTISGRVVRSFGAFTNTGPIPPKADTTTTYTVIWTIGNTANSVSGAQVVATLPTYVKWLNAISPTTEDVSYDSNSGTVTWNAGNIGAYSSLDSSKRREVAFQISIQPSVNQAGNVPILVNPAALTATDDFTSTTLQSQQGSLTTSFSTDPVYKVGDEMVAK